MNVLVVGVGNSRITFLERLIMGLSEQGTKITIAAPHKPDNKQFDNKNVGWLWAPSMEGVAISRILKLIVLIITQVPSQRIQWLVKSLKARPGGLCRWIELYQLLPFTHGQWDVIYFTWNSAAIEYKALYDLGIPVIVSCRGSQVNIRPHQPCSEEFTQGLIKSLQTSDAVHCVSQDILDEALQFGLNPVKARVIRPAVDPLFFIPLGVKKNNNRFTLITTGSLIWRKGYEYALMTLRNLVDQGIDAEIQIIGDGPERQRILYTALDLNLKDRVILHGKLPPEAVRSYLQQADAFLLSSLSEGISNAVLEAMSCGLPVVTTDCGGMREAVNDGVEGFVVPVRDPSAAADALVKLWKDVEFRIRMGQAGRTRIQQDFDLRDQASAFINLFNSVKKDSK